jgi:thiol-disulfide isomerase/thioredoxin
LQGATFATAAAPGQVLVVDFFAGYCAPCRRALPAVQALHQRNPQLILVGVSLDEDAQRARQLVARYGLTFPVIHDPQGVLAGRFRVTELPASFVIDHSGRVAWAGGGEQPADGLSRAALAALREVTASAPPAVSARR